MPTGINRIEQRGRREWVASILAADEKIRTMSIGESRVDTGLTSSQSFR